MSTAIILFAKAPQAGHAKTRLIPALGPTGAAHLAERLLIHAVQQAMDTGFEHVELCVTPDELHPVFQGLIQRYQRLLRLSRQTQGDLGERMHSALARVLQTHEHVLLMGTDAPALTTERLLQASQSIQAHDAVFVPATDGGYALAGFKQAHEQLFVNMPWSTPDVMLETRRRLLAIAWSWHELPPISDIDEPCDLVHAPPEWLP